MSDKTPVETIDDLRMFVAVLETFRDNVYDLLPDDAECFCDGDVVVYLRERLGGAA